MIRLPDTFPHLAMLLRCVFGDDAATLRDGQQAELAVVGLDHLLVMANTTSRLPVLTWHDADDHTLAAFLALLTTWFAVPVRTATELSHLHDKAPQHGLLIYAGTLSPEACLTISLMALHNELCLPTHAGAAHQHLHVHARMAVITAPDMDTTHVYGTWWKLPMRPLPADHPLRDIARLRRVLLAEEYALLHYLHQRPLQSHCASPQWFHADQLPAA